MRAGSQPHGEPGAALTTHQESAIANHAPANRQLSPPAIQPEPGCNQQPIMRAGESREHPPIQHAPTTHQEPPRAGESNSQPGAPGNRAPRPNHRNHRVTTPVAGRVTGEQPSNPAAVKKATANQQNTPHPSITPGNQPSHGEQPPGNQQPTANHRAKESRGSNSQPGK